MHGEVTKVLMSSERPDENHSEPSHQDVIKVKEEFTDPTYDMFYMSQYGLYNGGVPAWQPCTRVLHRL